MRSKDINTQKNGCVSHRRNNANFTRLDRGSGLRAKKHSKTEREEYSARDPLNACCSRF